MLVDVFLMVMGKRWGELGDTRLKTTGFKYPNTSG
jgi:hypothetical protein